MDLNPLGKNMSPPSAASSSYKEDFLSLDLQGLTKEIVALMTEYQSWWQADYGRNGPFFVRIAWHAAGTYRFSDGSGGGGRGNLRFSLLNSWADPMIFTGNYAMVLQPSSFAWGHEDKWEPEEDIYRGQEKVSAFTYGSSG